MIAYHIYTRAIFYILYLQYVYLQYVYRYSTDGTSRIVDCISTSTNVCASVVPHVRKHARTPRADKQISRWHASSQRIASVYFFPQLPTRP